MLSVPKLDVISVMGSYPATVYYRGLVWMFKSGSDIASSVFGRYP